MIYLEAFYIQQYLEIVGKPTRARPKYQTFTAAMGRGGRLMACDKHSLIILMENDLYHNTEHY